MCAIVLHHRFHLRSALLAGTLAVAVLGLASTVPAAGRPAAAVIVDDGKITSLDDLVARNEPSPAATIEDGAEIATLNDLYPAAKALPPVIHAGKRRRQPASAGKPAEQPVTAVAPRPPVVTVPPGQTTLARDSRAPVVTLLPPDTAR